MKSYEPRCVICGASDASLWTLDNESRAVATYLCKRDAAPLMTIMDATKDLPPSLQKPLSDKKEAEPQPVHQRHRRMAPLEPLLDWTPPSPPPVVETVKRDTPS